MTELKGKRVALIVTDGFEQIEMTSPREALDKAGAKTVLVSPKDGKVQGFKHHDKADSFDVDLALSKANASEFDAVVLPGGVINGDALRIEKRAQQFVQEMDRAGKPIAVICHGGWLLISGGLVKGRRITTWPTLQDDMRNAGADWQDREVIRDRNLVSSRKPDDLPAFNREMLGAIGETRPSKAPGDQQRDSLEVRQ
ncbi:MAG: type 1 glutamine amidotransferase [Acidobacteria bacterium]|nr:type 1 glutamine amidotransferase [Acidobacteriota bacterium]MBV9067182.1 type 1 glutamine amidotransferase [Acidobacteriota bacterium]MBV9185608.1 type 1 glutamine amidotransferase [Acidobacteriota bacterium]